VLSHVALLQEVWGSSNILSCSLEACHNLLPDSVLRVNMWSLARSPAAGCVLIVWCLSWPTTVFG